MDEFAVFTVIAMTPSGDESSGGGRLTGFVPKSGVESKKKNVHLDAVHCWEITEWGND